jgi:hypothetical protein
VNAVRQGPAITLPFSRLDDMDRSDIEGWRRALRERNVTRN